MMRLFLNCLAASAGGGLTYLRNVVPHLSVRTDVQTMVAASARLKREIGELPNLSWASLDPPRGVGRRFWQEQTRLPDVIRNWNADVLVSAGNFALRKSPVPQILLSGNSLYASADFSRDLRSRRDYRLLLDTCFKGTIAKRSVRWADCTVAPSESFAQELREWTGASVVVVHHGFDHQTFSADSTPLPDDILQKLDSGRDTLRLLFVSHYNYYRNFETLLRAIPLLQERMAGRRVMLFLTCSLRSEGNPGTYRAETAAALVRNLGVTDQVLELGAIPYHLLHQLYRRCDIYVTPAYAETFAHPLVEAMASGLPVVASDLPVHREICGDAALYFPRFSPESLADRVVQLDRSSVLQKQSIAAGVKRSHDFSWQTHVERIVTLAQDLVRPGQARKENANAGRELRSSARKNPLR